MTEKEDVEKRQDAQAAEELARRDLYLLNRTPWPAALVPGLPRPCDLVHHVDHWTHEDHTVFIEVYLNQGDAEVYFAKLIYFAKLKDLGLSYHGSYPNGKDVVLKSTGDGFYLSCLYLKEWQYLRITFVYENRD